MSIAPGLESQWTEAAPPTPLRRRRLRLISPPVPLTPLIGRSAEIEAASAMLTRREARLVTLVGPGGIGKTRLAMHVATTCASAFDGQVAWAPVASATTPGAVSAVLARAVGLTDVGANPPIETLKAILHDQSVLLVVDNFEQALDAAPLLTDLLIACPGLSMLVTSRALLRVGGERPLDVPPLATTAGPPGPGQQTEMAPAVQLFAQHAASVLPTFAITAETTQIVAEICRRLDGLPLAIELAAARSRLLPPAGLLARLDRRLPQLTTGQRDAPARHRTMRDAIAWSYDLLSPAEQAVFRCLGAFVGGFTLEAAEAVCPAPADENDATPDAPDTVITAIDVLASQSLLQIESSSSVTGVPRLTMLETVREFAMEQLDASGDVTPKRRHAEYFLALATRAEQSFRGEAADDLRTTLGLERANIREALDWALAHGEAEIALSLGSAMFDPIWMTSDDAREQHHVLERALALPGGSSTARVHALVSACWASSSVLNGFDEGVRPFEEALAVARQFGDDAGIATALYGLGNSELHARQFASARRYLEESLDRFRALNARGWVGWTLCALASLDSRDDDDEDGEPIDPARAVARYEEALSIFRATGEQRSIARALHGLAYVTYKQRDLPRALAMTHEVLALDWREGWPVFHYLEDIGDIAGRLGQPAVAARLYGVADAQREQFGRPVEPLFRAEYERDVAVARRALGDVAFSAAWQAGRSLKPEQAVAEALAVAVQPPTPSSPLLSPREIEVMRMLADGLSDREIASALFIGERTVNTHVARAFVKLGVHNRAAAVAAAIAAGLLLSPPPGTNPS